jgi:transcriptional regulator with XRE-family HTH domain
MTDRVPILCQAQWRATKTRPRMTRRNPPTIGAILRAARQDVRFTQSDFADALGVARRTLSRWEFNDTVPKPEELPRIVSQTYELDSAVGERLARELGVASPAPSPQALQEALARAADALGVTPERLGAALVPLVARWRELGCSLRQIAASVGAEKK